MDVGKVSLGGSKVSVDICESITALLNKAIPDSIGFDTDVLKVVTDAILQHIVRPIVRLMQNGIIGPIDVGITKFGKEIQAASDYINGLYIDLKNVVALAVSAATGNPISLVALLFMRIIGAVVPNIPIASAVKYATVFVIVFVIGSLYNFYDMLYKLSPI